MKKLISLITITPFMISACGPTGGSDEPSTPGVDLVEIPEGCYDVNEMEITSADPLLHYGEVMSQDLFTKGLTYKHPGLPSWGEGDYYVEYDGNEQDTHDYDFTLPSTGLTEDGTIELRLTQTSWTGHVCPTKTFEIDYTVNSAEDAWVTNEIDQIKIGYVMINFSDQASRDSDSAWEYVEERALSGLNGLSQNAWNPFVDMAFVQVPKTEQEYIDEAERTIHCDPTDLGICPEGYTELESEAAAKDISKAQLQTALDLPIEEYDSIIYDVLFTTANGHSSSIAAGHHDLDDGSEVHAVFMHWREDQVPNLINKVNDNYHRILMHELVHAFGVHGHSNWFESITDSDYNSFLSDPGSFDLSPYTTSATGEYGDWLSIIGGRGNTSTDYKLSPIYDNMFFGNDNRVDYFNTVSVPSGTETSLTLSKGGWTKIYIGSNRFEFGSDKHISNNFVYLNYDEQLLESPSSTHGSLVARYSSEHSYYDVASSQLLLPNNTFSSATSADKNVNYTWNINHSFTIGGVTITPTTYANDSVTYDISW